MSKFESIFEDESVLPKNPAKADFSEIVEKVQDNKQFQEVLEDFIAGRLNSTRFAQIVRFISEDIICDIIKRDTDELAG